MNASSPTHPDLDTLSSVHPYNPKPDDSAETIRRVMTHHSSMIYVLGLENERLERLAGRAERREELERPSREEQNTLLSWLYHRARSYHTDERNGVVNLLIQDALNEIHGFVSLLLRQGATYDQVEQALNEWSAREAKDLLENPSREQFARAEAAGIASTAVFNARAGQAD